MKCIGCGKNSATIALIEAFPCRHCNGEIHLEYNVCQECGKAWKTVDGEFISGTMLFDTGLGEAYYGEEEMKDEEEKMSYMNDYIHKCLKCNSIACEVEPNLYRCPICGFEWEVIKSG